MIIGIDAHNIRGNGGSLIHLKEFLTNTDPISDNFEKLIVWTTNKTYENLPKYKFINYILLPERNSISALYWQKLKLEKEAKKHNCSILFFPGGLYLGNFKPFVALAQSMLPFDEKGQSFYKGTLFYYILIIKKFLMIFTYKRANGIIYVSNSMKKKIEKYVKNSSDKGVVIHHGVNKMFAAIRTRKFMEDGILRLVTFSNHALHKNLMPLCKLIADFRKAGNNVELKIIGPKTKYGTKALLNLLKEIDPLNQYIEVIPDEKYEKLPYHLNSSDIFIAPSLCESFGLPLKEALVNQIPILYQSLESFNEIIDSNVFTANTIAYNYIENDFNTVFSKTLKLLRNSSLELIDYSCGWKECSNTTINYLKTII